MRFNVVEKAGVRGRSKETITLKKLYRDCAQVSKVLIVEGKAGVGKTALIRSQHNELFSDGHFVSGTFDQQRKSEPFSAIVDALHELFDELLGEEYSLDENSVVKEIMDQFSDESKNDAGMRSVLQNAFPMFIDLVEAKRDESRLQQEAFDMSGHSWALKKSSRKRQVTEKRTSSTEGGGRKGWNFEKLKISLRLLLKCICNAKRRVVIFLDDLHYADPSSLELIEFLASGDGLSPIPSKVDEDSPIDQVKGLMLILAYRNAASDASKSDAITIDHPFRVRLKELKLLKCPIHRIHVKDLELEVVNEIVSHVTRYSDKPDTTMPLSEVIFKKTGGNAFSVLNMLEFLEHEKLLFFSMNDYKWKWKNVRTIHSATDISDSVVDMVALKLKSMPPATQQILMVASCLGSYFRLEVVAAYFRKHNDDFHKVDFEAAAQEALANGEASEEEEEEKKDGNGSGGSRRVSLDANGKPKSTLLDRMIKLLELPLRQDLLTKRRKSTTYFFAHKQLQTAAYALIKGQDKARRELHWRLGQLMKYKSQQFPEEHWMAYLACDQLNRGLTSLSSEERVELAQMNLQIAMMSQEKSAFVPAAEFLRAAILLLFQEDAIQDPAPKGGCSKGSPSRANQCPAWSKLYSCSPTQYKAVWKECYDICVDMFSSLAEMEYLLGNHKASKQAVDEVLQNAQSEEDKFRAQVILIESISAQRNFDSAIDTCLKILAAAYDMKLSASPMKLQIMNEKKKVNRMLEQQIQSDSDDKSRGEMSTSFSNDGSLNGSQTSLSTRTAPILPVASSRQGPISRIKSNPVVGQATKPAGAMSRIKSTTRSSTRTSLLPKNVMPKNEGRRTPSIMPKNGGRFQKAVSSESAKITRMFQKKQEQAMMTLPKMTDDQHMRISKLLSQLMLNAILSGKTDLSAYIGLRSIRFSFQHGISPHSPMALAAYGISQAKEGKYNEAYANGMLALKLLDIAESKDWYTRTILKCHNLRHIKKPFHESLDPMMEGYRTGVESGDMEYALVAAMHYALLYMFVGLPLAPLEPDLMAFAEQVHRYHLPFVLEVTFYIYRGYVLALQGEESDEMVFKDDDEAKNNGDGNLSVSSSIGVNEVYIDKRVRPLVEREMCIVKMQKFYLFGQYEEAEKMMNQLSELPAFDYSVLRTINREAFFGLINLALAKTTGKKRFRERASKIIDEFKVYVKHGSVNSHHILLLLQAEEASVNATEWESVVKSYDECISNAARSGFTNHEALGNELAGLFLHEMRKTNKKAKMNNAVAEQYQNYISRAMALYTEWGAKAKVEQLEKKFPQLQPSNLLQGANVKARRRFSRTLTARFRDMKLHSGRWSVGASSDLKILDGFDDLKDIDAPDLEAEGDGNKIDPYGFAAGSRRF